MIATWFVDDPLEPRIAGLVDPRDHRPVGVARGLVVRAHQVDAAATDHRLPSPRPTRPRRRKDSRACADDAERLVEPAEPLEDLAADAQRLAAWRAAPAARRRDPRRPPWRPGRRVCRRCAAAAGRAGSRRRRAARGSPSHSRCSSSRSPGSDARSPRSRCACSRPASASRRRVREVAAVRAGAELRARARGSG